jgi:hypothetical protein
MRPAAAFLGTYAWWRTALAGTVIALSTSAVAQVSPQICGSLENPTGPFDYRVQRGNELHLVESAHFTPRVELVMRGERGYLGQDLDYTLRVYPNHHRALVAIIRYEGRVNFIKPIDRIPRPAECYFERAIRWKADDVVTRMLYAQFLYLKSRSDEARAQLQAAEGLAQDNPLTRFNIGLTYLEGKDYEHALRQAHLAVALGYERPELREKLVAAGRWVDPPAAASAPASAASR